MWEAVLDICQYRQEAIRKLNTDLREIETRRRTLTFDVLRSYFLVFERIAHLLPQDVKKMMETETQVNCSTHCYHGLRFLPQIRCNQTYVS